ncbi:RAD55 family ATPase [Pseudorhizobium flavum]|uniref:RAD55 family ATPase n=1 Tax=Pseudorhizobium flavum TaxID=1335061 RepID=UPI00376F932E
MTQSLSRIISGVDGLDEVLGGGLVEGASYIVQGQPGAGKTIMANQVAFANVRAGRKVLYITLLAETHDRLFQVLGTLDFFDRSQLGITINSLSFPGHPRVDFSAACPPRRVTASCS